MSRQDCPRWNLLRAPRAVSIQTDVPGNEIEIMIGGPGEVTAEATRDAIIKQMRTLGAPASRRQDGRRSDIYLIYAQILYRRSKKSSVSLAMPPGRRRSQGDSLFESSRI